MPPLPTYRKKRLPSTNVGAAPLPLDAANVAGGAIGQGLSAFGGGVSDVGGSLFKIVQDDMQNKDSIATTRYNQIMQNAKIKHEAFRESVGDETKWEENREQVYNEAKAEADKLVWGSADGKFGSELTTTGLLENSKKSTELFAIRKRKAEALEVTKKNYIEALSEPITPYTTEVQKAAIELQIEASREMRKKTLESEFGEDAVKSILEEEAKVGADIRSENLINATSKTAFDVWQSSVTKADLDGDLNVAFDVIQASGMRESEKQDAESELKNRVTNRRAENKLRLEAVQEESRDIINKALFDSKDYEAANALIEASPLSEKEQGTFLKLSSQRATAAAKGIPLANDRVVESEMYDLSLGIWKGNITKKEFDTQLLAVAGKLDDTAWKRITSSASNTLKTSQAESLSRASSSAKNVLVDFKSEDAFAKFISDSIKGLEPDVAKAFEDNAVENRQLQFNSLTQYDSEIRDWIAANPDKVGKDFFQYSESLKHEYWNKNIEDLRLLRAEQNKEVLSEVELSAEERTELFNMVDVVDRDTLPELETIIKTGDVELIRKAMGRLRGTTK